jgi:4-amino-4-deoxy-L-arabinose transferase-like glycosyltransferase
MSFPSPSPSPSSAAPARLRAAVPSARVLTAVLLAALAGLMLATVRDYGMTGDEGVQHRYARRLLRYYATLGADRSAAADEDVSMYGGFFETVAEAAAALSPDDPYLARHVVNVLFSLAAFAAVARMGAHLAGGMGGLFALLALALTPPFYGHAFNNPKDIPFAATFAVAACVVLVVSDRSPHLRGRDTLAAGIAIGLTAAVRVAGIALFGFALVLWVAVALAKARGGIDGQPPPRRHELARLATAWLGVVTLGWAVMIALWPWAQAAPVRNPLRALRAFSRFWETMVVFYDGRYVPNGEVSRLYVPTWLALTLPELYLAAALMGLAALGAVIRRPPRPGATRRRLLQCAWLAAVAILPVAWAVLHHTPLYDGVRHFLFVMPPLAVLAGVSVAAFFRQFRQRRAATPAGVVLAGLALVTASDMAALHPYEALYFNRLVAGGLRRAVERYDADYWCLTYKEGAEWLLRRYAGARCRDKIRVAGNSILLQVAYYLRASDEGRRLFAPVGLADAPHFALVTTRFGDHLRTPGRLVHTVDRQGARLLYVFELEAPSCEAAP